MQPGHRHEEFRGKAATIGVMIIAIVQSMLFFSLLLVLLLYEYHENF